jgi:hypothetical protein
VNTGLPLFLLVLGQFIISSWVAFPDWNCEAIPVMSLIFEALKNASDRGGDLEAAVQKFIRREYFPASREVVLMANKFM